MKEPTNRQTFWKPERIYFFKSYAGWWLLLAFVGSLLANGPSQSFIAAVWNPLVWNVAGFSALLFASLQTHYRTNIRRFFDRRSVGAVMFLLYLLLQGYNMVAYVSKHPLDTRFIGVTAVAVLGTLVATAVVLIIVLAVAKQIQKQLPQD